ncbi:hypothetical protein B0T16DRAFT_337862 [Cercophora newfieldiana]|uniref:Uncharacterized protein n=1 Tax=Cercophora newfieldiana TaxID=92897 RepID=A0AA40CIW4_9PEZI|nr:hypothetical protein B0T16DRAFT_337862 [Cercophora newfieldiana]
MAGPSGVPLATLLVVGGYSFLYSGALDAVLLASFSIFRHWRSFSDLVGPYLPLQFTKIAAAALATAVLASWTLRAVQTKDETPQWDGPGKVLLFPGRTTHSRFFPKKHSFSYSYLVVGVPVGFEGSVGGMVSVGVRNKAGLASWFPFASRARTGWFTVDPADYLERGEGELGLRGKLDAYLRTQGVDPVDYPHAYLVTAARFLGYHFNPVSFWYLYDGNKSLAAMILEVNNTFDERRMYFLPPDDELVNQIGAAVGGDGVADARQDVPSRTVLKQKWPKDFHVSPFNSRKGSYSLSASDPLSPYMQGTGPVTNTINLVSSKGHGKLVARLIPEGSSLDPEAMSWFAKLKFLASWWWVGFLTFPRIVKEAANLWFKRKLHVWFRPEPLKTNIGRHADTTERELEPIFRRYLRHLVEQSPVPLALKYVPSGIPDAATELMRSPRALTGDEAVEEIEFKVLTPVFYSRFVYYAHDVEALFCELQESCTIWISQPDLLPKFALKKPAPTLASSNYLEFAYFKLIQRLRVRPERIDRPLTSSASPAPTAAPVDIRGFRISPMDGYVLSQETDSAKMVYRNCVLRLFLADRIALSIIPLLSLERLLLQATFAWLLSPTFGRVLLSLTEYLRRRLGA